MTRPRICRVIGSHPAEVPQLAVVALAPGEDLAVHGQGHGVAAARVHRHLLHHVVAEGGDLPRDGHRAAGQAQAQPAVGGLAAGVHLALHRHWGGSTRTPLHNMTLNQTQLCCLMVF